MYWVKPTREKPHHALVTSGMSGRTMTTPESVKEYNYPELSICRTEEWKISEKDFKYEKNYWPIRWLKYFAKFLHEYNT